MNFCDDIRQNGFGYGDNIDININNTTSFFCILITEQNILFVHFFASLYLFFLQVLSVFYTFVYKLSGLTLCTNIYIIKQWRSGCKN